MDGKSLNINQDKLNKLKELIPEAFTEDNKIDVEKLKLTLGEDIELSNERYVLNWAGKSEAFKVLQTPTTATLAPDKDESVNFDTTENIFIEGENLEVLKVLQKSYYGKIKMIYIDPPYNTGNDSFIYPDKYSQTKEEYLKRIGEKDEEGYLLKEGLFRKNSKENGQYHSNWLNMMYPRLFLARNLLRDDGVIFVSIDDNEVHNLKLMLNEIFGEENYVECITWNKRIPKNDKGIGNIHEYILVYLKKSDWDYKFVMSKEGLDEINELVSKLAKKHTPISEAESELRKLYEKKGYDRGITLYNSLDENYKIWGKINLSWPNANTFGPRYEIIHPVTKKPVKVPDRGWRWKLDTFNDYLDYENVKILNDGSSICGQIWFDKDENTQPSLVKYLDDVDNLLLRSVLSLKSDGGIEVESLFEGKSYFSYPKPTSLIKMLVKSFNCNEGDIIMDFFAGSGTTADAVIQANVEDNINRHFLIVQLEEETGENSEAKKGGYVSISSIAEERIKRVINKTNTLISKMPQLFENKSFDLGFKVFNLKYSNFKLWRGDVIENGDDLSKQIDVFENPVREGTEEENILYELILKSGYELTSKIEKQDELYLIADNDLIIALNKIDDSIIDKIIQLKPKKCIVLDELFKGNDQLKTNTVLQMKDAGIEFKTV